MIFIKRVISERKYKVEALMSEDSKIDNLSAVHLQYDSKWPVETQGNPITAIELTLFVIVPARI